MPKFRALRDSGAFAAVTAYHDEDVNLTERGDPEVLHGERISREFFDVWGVEPLLGRRFSAAEDAKGGGDVALLSEGLWRRRFGGDPGIVGKSVRLEGRPYTVIGVLPDMLRFPFRDVQIWLPRAQELAIIPEAMAEHGRRLPRRGGAAEAGHVAGRRAGRGAADQRPLRPGATRRTSTSSFRLAVVPMDEQLVGKVRSSLGLLLGAVALVLLIACADVANLLLAQGLARRKEVAIRMAMGASAGRVVRQRLAEGVVLALLGSVVGLALAYGGPAAAGRLPPRQPAARRPGGDRPPGARLHPAAVAGDRRALLADPGPAEPAHRGHDAAQGELAGLDGGAEPGPGAGSSSSPPRSPWRWCCWSARRC